MAALEKVVWEFTDAEDVIPPALLIVSIKRGGILLGAFDEVRMLRGFVYSMPAVKDGQLTQWSHLLGVARRAKWPGASTEACAARSCDACRYRSNRMDVAIRFRLSMRTSISRGLAR